MSLNKLVPVQFYRPLYSDEAQETCVWLFFFLNEISPMTSLSNAITYFTIDLFHSPANIPYLYLPPSLLQISAAVNFNFWQISRLSLE